MSEVHGEQGADQYDEFKAIMIESVGGTFPALRNFDTARHELYTKLSRLTADDLGLEVAEQMDVDGVSERFGTLLGYTLEESESVDDFVGTCVYMMTSDSSDRISVIQKALDDDCAGLANDPDSLIREFTKLVYRLESLDDVVECMVRFYDNDIKADIDHLVEGLSEDKEIFLDDSDTT